jgi:hypothetical protein
MAAVITYDVSGKQIQVKDAMKKKGYSDSWTYQEKGYNLPDTTLYKKDANAATALADIQAVAAQVQVRLERALALDLGNWEAIPGDAHSA